MIEVTRDENGCWWTNKCNRVYTGEDALVLDKLFGKDEGNNTPLEEIEEAVSLLKSECFDDSEFGIKADKALAHIKKLRLDSLRWFR